MEKWLTAAVIPASSALSTLRTGKERNVRTKDPSSKIFRGHDALTQSNAIDARSEMCLIEARDAKLNQT